MKNLFVLKYLRLKKIPNGREALSLPWFLDLMAPCQLPSSWGSNYKRKPMELILDGNSGIGAHVLKSVI